MQPFVHLSVCLSRLDPLTPEWNVVKTLNLVEIFFRMRAMNSPFSGRKVKGQRSKSHGPVVDADAAAATLTDNQIRC